MLSSIHCCKINVCTYFHSKMLSPIKELDEMVVRAISRRESQTQKAKIQPKTKRCLEPSAKSMVVDKDEFNKHCTSNNSKNMKFKDIEPIDVKTDIKKIKMRITKDNIFEPNRQLNDVINVVKPAVEPVGGTFENEMK